MSVTADDSRPTTSREQKKAIRREELLDAAAHLFAERGFASVRLEDLGSAVGISGPAVYRHFPNKDAVLVELLVGISEHLVGGGERVAGTQPDAHSALAALIEFHLDFTFGQPSLIRIQDRDLSSLPDTARRKVRRMQREYVEIWVAVLRRVDPDLAEDDARTRAHATFGLLNSTPYSAGSRTAQKSARARIVLREMATAALGVT